MLRILIVATVAATLLLPGVTAEAGGFGTQVDKESDFAPLAKRAWTTAGAALPSTGAQADNQLLSVLRKTLGDASVVTDDAFVIDVKGPVAGANVDFEDILLTPYGDKKAGDLISDTDTILKGAATQQIVTALWADSNNDGKFKEVDYAFVVYAAAGTPATKLLPTNSVTSWTIRLTDTPSGKAGSFVFASDADFLAYQSAVTQLGMGYDTTPIDAPGTTEKRCYTTAFEGAGVNLICKSDGTAAAWSAATDPPQPNTFAPRYSLRLSKTDQFGSFINSGANDFVPTAKSGQKIITNSANVVLRKTLGDASAVTDDAFYFDVKTPGASIDFDDLRVTQGPGGAAGSKIADADTIEKGTAGISSETVSVLYADANNNGRYDADDFVYIVSGGAATALAATTSTTSYSIRLTPAAGKPAGTFVFASDNDFTSYANGVKTAYFSTIGEFDGAKWYVSVQTTTAITTGAALPIHALRAAESSKFGQQIKFGDSEFRPGLIGSGFTTDDQFLRVALGDTPVTDDCILVDSDGSATVTNFDILLTPCLGKTPGSLVGDADTVLRAGSVTTYVQGSATGYSIAWADVNNDGKYKAGDDVYLLYGTGGKLLATTSATSWTIRLTPSGNLPAGSYVFASDPDFAAYSSAVTVFTQSNTAGATDFDLLYFDADNSGSFTPGDSAYFAAIVGSSYVPRYSVRLHGDLAATTPASSSPAASTNAPSSAPAPISVVTTKTFGGAKPSTSDSANTPALELIGLATALGGVLVFLRRKL